MQTRLSSYAKYAGAIAATAVAPSATAEIIYNDLTMSITGNQYGTVNLVTGVHATGSGTSGGAGLASFSIRWHSVDNWYSNPVKKIWFGTNIDRWYVGGGLNQRIGPHNHVSALEPAALISASGNWTSADRLRSSTLSQWTSSYIGGFTGLWEINETAFVGFQISIDGETKYAWAHLTLTTSELTLSGYAYEDSGDSIQAGQIPAPGALGLMALAAGAGGIRRRRAG